MKKRDERNKAKMPDERVKDKVSGNLEAHASQGHEVSAGRARRDEEMATAIISS